MNILELLQKSVDFIDNTVTNVYCDRIPALDEDQLQEGSQLRGELVKLLDAMQGEAAVSCDPTKWLCPHCRQRPVATLTKTYYAEISGYVCGCTRILGSVECQGDAYA